MHIPLRPRPFVLAVIACLLAVPWTSTRAAARDLLIFAAASTADAINAAIEQYGAADGKIRASYASSGALARQIGNGAPADLYLSANTAWIDWAQKNHLLEPGTIARLLSNRLVLIAPQDSKSQLRIAPGFPLRAALGDGRLAIGDPTHVPAGTYARAALKNLKVWKSVADRTARTRDVRAALALVERGEVPFGIVYRTDALLTKKVRTVDVFPEASHPPIVYSLAIVAGRDSKEARKFYAYLRSPAAVPIYSRLGFQPGW